MSERREGDARVVELMLAFASLAAGGVLERHPGLRCAFLEGTCGWLPWWLWRLDEAWEKFGPGSEVKVLARPSEYFFRQCFVATDADEVVELDLGYAPPFGPVWDPVHLVARGLLAELAAA